MNERVNGFKVDNLILYIPDVHKWGGFVVLIIDKKKYWWDCLILVNQIINYSLINS